MKFISFIVRKCFRRNGFLQITYAKIIPTPGYFRKVMTQNTNRFSIGTILLFNFDFLFTHIDSNYVHQKQGIESWYVISAYLSKALLNLNGKTKINRLSLVCESKMFNHLFNSLPVCAVKQSYKSISMNHFIMLIFIESTITLYYTITL